MLKRYELCLLGLVIGKCFAILGCHHESRAQLAVEIEASERSMSDADVTVEQARRLLESNTGYIYLDVRTAGEFEAGRPPGAINIPIAEANPATGQIEFNSDFLHVVDVRIPRDARVIVGCRSGGRSARARDILRNEGYTNVVNMTGGFGGVEGRGGQIVEPGWSASGYPVEQGDAGERSYKSISGSEPRH